MRDPSRYQQMLRDLITQGLYQLLEQSVTVRCRSQDVQCVKVTIIALQDDCHPHF